MPKWTPGKLKDGTVVRVQYAVPLTYRLQSFKVFPFLSRTQKRHAIFKMLPGENEDYMPHTPLKKGDNASKIGDSFQNIN